MAQVTEKVIEIKAKIEGEKTVKQLKDQIAELTHLMDTLDTESLEYHRTVDMLVDAQEELNTVMKAGKSQLSAQEGSYNALVNRMAALKKAQKAVTDEASRMRLGDEIRKINDQLKEIDANNGVYVRNVGNYENAIKSALKTPQQELKALRQQLAQLTEGTAEYNAVFARMADLTHKVTEQQEMLKWSSADLGDILGNLAGVATSVAGGFSAFNALGGLLGMGENEDMEKAMLQAQRFIQLIQGLEQLEQLGDKIRGLWQGIENFAKQTAAGTLALVDFAEETTETEERVQAANVATNATAAATSQAANATIEYADAVDTLTVAEQGYIPTEDERLKQIEKRLVLLNGMINRSKKYRNASEEQVQLWESEKEALIKEHKAITNKTEATEEDAAATVAATAAGAAQTKGIKARIAAWILEKNTVGLTKAQVDAFTTSQLLATAATTGLTLATKLFTKALIATGIGAILVLLGSLISLLGKGIGKLWGWISGANKAQEQTDALKASLDALNETLAAQEKAWERQEMLMEAQGKSYEEIYEARRKNLQAQLAETQALLATQRAIANDIGQRKLQKKKYDEFRETLDELVAKEKELKQTIDDLDYKNYIDDIKAKKKAEEEAAAAAKKAAEQAKSNYNKQKEEADKLYKSLIEHYKTEEQKLREKYEEEKKLLEKYGKDTTLLTKKYEEDKTAIVLKQAELRRKLREQFTADILKSLENPSLEYFNTVKKLANDKNQLFEGLGKSLGFENINLSPLEEASKSVKMIKDELAKNPEAMETFTKGLADLNAKYGLSMKTVDDFILQFKIARKEFTDASEDMQKYVEQVKQNVSDEEVAIIEAQIAAIQKLMEWEAKEKEAKYNLYASEQDFYIGFTNNYITQMYKRWETEDAIFELRKQRINEEIALYKAAAENSMLTEEEKIAAMAKAAELERQLALETTEHTIAQNQRKTEATDNYVATVQDSLNGISQILGDVASAWETSIQAQVDAGEISEEEGEKQMENMRGIQSAIAMINALASAVSAYQSMAAIPFVGPALGAAAAAAALASGIAQVVAINKVKKGEKGGSDSTRYAEVTPTTPDYNPTAVTNVTGGQETENLANAMSNTPIWVSVKDIDNAQSKVKTREKESTF